jgi:hypothetical protein
MIKQKKKSEDPSPLQMKVCACGCEIKFQPRRSDQLHLNSKHYNYAYNHGKRKIKYAQENSANKVIRKNDRILEKYFKVFKETDAILNFAIVKADGFNEGMFTSIIGIKRGEAELRFHALFKYSYRILKQADIRYIEIIEL